MQGASDEQAGCREEVGHGDSLVVVAEGDLDHVAVAVCGGKGLVVCVCGDLFEDAVGALLVQRHLLRSVHGEDVEFSIPIKLPRSKANHARQPAQRF